MNSWIKGFLIVLGASAFTAGAQVLQNRLMNGKAAPPITGGTLGGAALAAGASAFVAYLTQSPIPPTTPAPLAK